MSFIFLSFVLFRCSSVAWFVRYITHLSNGS